MDKEKAIIKLKTVADFVEQQVIEIDIQNKKEVGFTSQIFVNDIANTIKNICNFANDIWNKDVSNIEESKEFVNAKHDIEMQINLNIRKLLTLFIIKFFSLCNEKYNINKKYIIVMSKIDFAFFKIANIKKIFEAYFNNKFDFQWSNLTDGNPLIYDCTNGVKNEKEK